jgi:hypothetical protein
MEKIKVDCHTHTSFSFDGFIRPEQYVEQAIRVGLGAVVVSDHNTIAGARAIQALDPPFRVVVGEEIKTSVGEVMGLFLEEEIPAGKSPAWTMDAIHEQGALVLVPHPFARVVVSRLKYDALFANIAKVDIIEVVNARNEMARDEASALHFAQAFDLPTSAGSDAHLVNSLGRGYIEMDPFDDAASFLKSIRAGTLVCRQRTPLLLSGLTFAVAIAAIMAKSAIKKISRPLGLL